MIYTHISHGLFDSSFEDGSVAHARSPPGSLSDAPRRGRHGYIVVAVTRHGEDPVHPDAAYYENLENVEMKGFCFRNLDKEVADTDQYGMILRGLRALQYAKTRREWDGASLKVTGGSMGGYQALAMAGLDADVTSCSAFIPWHVDLSGGVKYGRMTGWRPDWTATMDYVDAKNFAKLVRCPVTFSAGLGDYVCPPSGEVLLFKNLPEPKKVTWTQNMGHGSTHGPDCAQYVMELPAPEPEPVSDGRKHVDGACAGGEGDAGVCGRRLLVERGGGGCGGRYAPVGTWRGLWPGNRLARRGLGGPHRARLRGPDAGGRVLPGRYGTGVRNLWCGRFGGGAYAAFFHGSGRPACRYRSRRHRPVFPLKGCCA